MLTFQGICKFKILKNWKLEGKQLERRNAGEGHTPLQKQVQEHINMPGFYGVCGVGPHAYAEAPYWALLPAQLHKFLFYFNTKTVGPVRSLCG